MIGFAVAIFGASLLGSLHCVGMCGPFALWATGKNRSPTVITSYHLGRLSTYLSAGLFAGVIGSTVTIGGQLAGTQMLAAKLAGSGLVVIGVAQMLRRSSGWAKWNGRRRTGQEGAVVPPSRIAGWLQAANPLLANQGPMGRAYLGGLLTTWLPCGWLYLFVLVAGGTGDVMGAIVVMLAFWVGTLPALTGLIYGAQSLALRFRDAIPTATSLLLILTGLYTATGRAAADLSKFHPRSGSVDAIRQLDQRGLEVVVESPLPCCEFGRPCGEKPLE